MSLLKLHRQLHTLAKKSGMAEVYQYVIDRYSDTRLKGTDLDADGDMLLFQWGIFDWGKGRHSSVDLTRQIITSEDGEDVIIQLRCTYQFHESVLASMESGDCWCLSPKDTKGFSASVLSNPAFMTSLKSTHIGFDCDINEQ